MIEDRSVQEVLGDCPKCGADCIDSPSGVVCLNGHGGVDPVPGPSLVPGESPDGADTRCPKCGAAVFDGVDGGYRVYECGTLRSWNVTHEKWSLFRHNACRLLEESVGVIHQLQAQVESLQQVQPSPEFSQFGDGPVSAYIPARPLPADLSQLRSRAEVWLEMARQSLAVVLYQDSHPEPDRLRRVYGPDMKRAVQQLADLREEVLLFIELQNAPRR